MTKKKCFPGPVFESLNALLDWIDSDFWVFIHDRAYHPSFIRNRMLGMVRFEQANGIIRACHDKNGEPYVSPNFNNSEEDKDGRIFDSSGAEYDRMWFDAGILKK